MKNIFSKANAPYIVGVTVAAIALVASGVFALAPYVAILAPVAALGVGLPFVIAGAVLSAVTIVLSAVAISKNNTISQQEKFENLVAARKKEEANEREKLKLPDVIALPESPRQEKFKSLVAARKKEEANEMAELKAKDSVPDVIELPYKLISAPDIIALPYKETEAPIQPNQPTKEEDGQAWISWGRDKVKEVGNIITTGVKTHAIPVISTVLTGIVVGAAFVHNGPECLPA